MVERLVPMTAVVVRLAAEEMLDQWVEFLLDDPHGYGAPEQIREKITQARALATALGKDFDELVKRGSAFELMRLAEIERG